MGVFVCFFLSLFLGVFVCLFSLVCYFVFILVNKVLHALGYISKRAKVDLNCESILISKCDVTLQIIQMVILTTHLKMNLGALRNLLLVYHVYHHV